MKRIVTSPRGIKALIVWFVVVGILLSLNGVKEIRVILSAWTILFCTIVFLAILTYYFSYINIYDDGSFRSIDWFYRKPKVYPKDVVSVGFVPTRMDRIYQQLFVLFKNSSGKIREFKINIKLYSPYSLAGVLNHAYESNSHIKLDSYCQNLLDKYHHDPEKMEKNWQDKFKIKWPLPQGITDILMFVLLLLSVYLFIQIANMHRIF